MRCRSRMPDPQQGPHGGTLRQSGSLQLETVVSQGGIQMFVFDREWAAIVGRTWPRGGFLRVEGNAKRYRYDLLPDGKGGLTAPVNLSQIAGRQIEIDLQLVGLRRNRQPTALPCKRSPRYQPASNNLHRRRSHVRKSVPSVANHLAAWGIQLRSTSMDKPFTPAVLGAWTRSSQTQPSTHPVGLRSPSPRQPMPTRRSSPSRVNAQ